MGTDIPITLEEFLAGLGPADLARAAATLPRHQNLSEDKVRFRLLNDLINHAAIRKRLDLLPVQEVANVFQEAVLNGGRLSLTQAHGSSGNGRLPPELLEDMLEQYFLGSVDHGQSVNGRIHEEPRVQVFPEIASAWLRNARPVLPPVFALENAAEPFADSVEFFMEKAREDQFSLQECSFEEFAFWVRSSEFPVAAPEAHLPCLHAVLKGERLEERLSQLEHKPFKPWDTLTEKERCRRALVHLVTNGESSLAAAYGRKLVQLLRTLEERHWFVPSAISHLLVLEEVKSGQWVSDLSLEELSAQLKTAFYPILRLTGVLETARSRGESVADRLTRDGVQALSQRIDWNHWERLAKVRRPGEISVPAQETEESSYLAEASGLVWEGSFDGFLSHLKKLYLAISVSDIPLTRKGEPDRRAIRRAAQAASLTVELAEFLIRFGQVLKHLESGSGRLLPGNSAQSFIDEWAPEQARAVASFFWNETFDDGPIAEDLRELKRVFITEYLGQARNGEFARLSEFWDWLEECPSQEKTAQRWRRYVDEDDEVLHSITVSMARPLGWLGLVHCSPTIDESQFVRLSPEGRSWLVNHRFEEQAGPKNSEGEIVSDGLSLRCDLGLPFDFLRRLSTFSTLSLEERYCDFLFTEERLKEAVLEGGNPNQLPALFSNFGVEPSDALAALLNRVLAKINAMGIEAASGLIEVESEELAEQISRDGSLSAMILRREGRILIFRPGLSMKSAAVQLNKKGYPVVWEHLADSGPA
ncbi:MAG: hypothetical protein QF473_09455 [Planctomycetota bacterium]|nr:hypothetical protein [Planctomycetota bacterium]